MGRARATLAHRLALPRARRIRPRFQPLVVCYHALSDEWEHPLAVRPETFARQLRVLVRRGFQPGSALDVMEGRGRLLHVTFDDAFQSVALALPVLEHLDLRATVFACPAYADEGRVFAVPELTAHARERPDALLTMDWDALRDLVARGVEVGSHTVTHPHLTTLQDDELVGELRESRQQLEDELRRPCKLVSYPYGEQDERVRRAARAAGYDAAFALPGIHSPPDRYALPRVGVYRADGDLRFRLKTSPLRRPAGALWHLARTSATVVSGRVGR